MGKSTRMKKQWPSHPEAIARSDKTPVTVNWRSRGVIKINLWPWAVVEQWPVVKKKLFGLPVVSYLFYHNQWYYCRTPHIKHDHSTLASAALLMFSCLFYWVAEAWKFAEATNFSCKISKLNLFLNSSFWIDHIFVYVFCTQDMYKCTLFQEVSHFSF